jgi:hypothetical protein
VIVLRRVPLFESLAPEDLQPITTVAEEEVFSEGELLTQRGDHGTTMYAFASKVRSLCSGPRTRRLRPEARATSSGRWL